MDLSVIILNWNVRDLLRRSLASIFSQTTGIAFEVIVVDNASSDGSAEMVRAEFPQVVLIVNPANLGFSKGNNVGLRQTRGDIVLVLNPDTEMVGNTLGDTVRFIREHPEAGLVGAEFVNEDGSHQPSVRRFPTMRDQALILLKLHNLFPQLPIFNRYFAVDLDPAKTQEVDQVSGTFFAMPHQILDDVGLLDERFFIWFEDVDYCRRVWQSGKKVLYTPEVKIKNRGGASFAQVATQKKQRLMNASLAKYIKKWHGIGPWLVIQSLRPASLAIAWLVGLFFYRGRVAEGTGSRRLKR